MANLTKTLQTATPIGVDDALSIYNEFRTRLGHGQASRGRTLLGQPEDNAKTAKTERPVVTLSLAPHRDVIRILRGEVDLPDLTVCPWSTPACREACVSYAGNGRWDRTQRLRAVKTAFAATNPGAFLSLLCDDIKRAAERYPNGAMRLNTFSDVAWERVLPFETFSILDAYDYTKAGIKRYRAARKVGYHLTLSVSERTNWSTVAGWLEEGANAAVVFDTAKSKALPDQYRGYRVVDGDVSDDRLADPAGVIVGLRAKGRLRERQRVNLKPFIRAKVA